MKKASCRRAGSKVTANGIIWEPAAEWRWAGISLTEKHFESHSAYVKSWISLLKSDHDAIFKAEKDAKKAVNFILSFLDDKQENIAV